MGRCLWILVIGNTGVRTDNQIPPAPPTAPNPEAPIRRSVIEKLPQNPVIQPNPTNQEFRSGIFHQDHNPLTQPQSRVPRENNRTHACTVIRENPLNRRPQMTMISDTVKEYYKNDGANANHIAPTMRPPIKRPDYTSNQDDDNYSDYNDNGSKDNGDKDRGDKYNGKDPS